MLFWYDNQCNGEEKIDWPVPLKNASNDGSFSQISNDHCQWLCTRSRLHSIPSVYFSGDWNLEIDPVTVDDDGTFQCQISPLRSRTAYVTVQVPPKDPYIEDGPLIRVKENVKVQLKCVAKEGKPPAQVRTWWVPEKNYFAHVFCKH